MPEQAPWNLSGSDGIDQYKHWKPEFQAKALEQLRLAETATWKPFFCPDATCSGHPHITEREPRDCPAATGHIWKKARAGWGCEMCGVSGDPRDDWLWEHARSDQRPPRWRDPWETLLMSGGRGSGKTRTGSELTHKATKITPRLALVAATGPDLRETMVEGRSGLLATAKPGERPVWEPSRKRLVWPNGCIGQGFSAEEPDRLRGPENGYAWVDEPAHFALIEDVWSMLDLNLRIPVPGGVKVIATSTPKPSKWLKALMAEEATVIHRVSTYANAHNLDPAFKRKILAKYEGTRLGQQELHGEMLEDVEGALWSYGIITWVPDHPHLEWIVIAVDPAGSTDKRADDTGIVVIGKAGDLEFVLGDFTGKYSPDQWGRKVWTLVDEFSADAVVAEKNYGGNMVKYVLETTKRFATTEARIQLVDSRRGKQIRAEPVVARYEQARIRHVGQRGDLATLEEEMTSWVPGEGASPNRVDALVHGSTALNKGHGKAQVARASDLTQRVPLPRHLRAV